ncbi:MAG: bifunctional 5,10-methylenetetrahydrofolate dehydrogenase/5,10-methenyltetrahydrofolate cyclohydrolase [bacterium]
MHLIDGKKIAKKIEEEIKKSKRQGGLAAILVGDDRASRLYVHLKEKAAARVGIKFIKILFPITNYELRITNNKKLENKIINKIKKLNNDKKITGIIVQLPLPKNLDTGKIISAMDPKKDVDGYHPKNIAEYQKNLCLKMPPAVFSAVRAILASINVSAKNKKIVFVSKGAIFPLPFAACFGKDAKSFVAANLKTAKKYLPSADIVITAVGKKHYLKGEVIKKGAIIIDIGIAREGHYVYGDADAKSLAKKTGWLTPVPGGVGPITVACLLKNTANPVRSRDAKYK